METTPVTPTQVTAAPSASWAPGVEETVAPGLFAGAIPRRNRGWLTRRALATADVLGLTAAFVISAVLVHTPATNLPGELSIFLLSTPVWLLLARLFDLYDKDENHVDHTTIDDIGPLFNLVTLGTWLTTIFLFVTDLLQEGRIVRLIWFWGFGILLMILARGAIRSIARRQSAFVQNTIIVGAGRVGQQLALKLARHPEYGINVVGFVDSQPEQQSDRPDQLTLLGPLEDIGRLVPLLRVERVIVAFSNEGHEEELAVIRNLQCLNVQIDIVPRLFDLTGANVQMHAAEGLPLVGLSRMQLSRSSRALKRALDLVVSSLLLIVFSPVMLVIALWIKLDSRGPVFFRQTRMGHGGSLFKVIKFRTMVPDADQRKREFEHLNKHLRPGGDPRMFKIENDPRVTRAGRVLRRFFLDELPQLINVVKGDMSLIGPRPLVEEEAQHVNDWGWRRLDLKPGMTGLWQVLGRSDIAFGEMVKLDYIYVTTWSLATDIRLLLRTIPLVFRGEAAV
jgi:exopolysaccharide biosynthesis polyprenyl glycosylphosphotransferase